MSRSDTAFYYGLKGCDNMKYGISTLDKMYVTLEGVTEVYHAEQGVFFLNKETTLGFVPYSNLGYYELIKNN